MYQREVVVQEVEAEAEAEEEEAEEFNPRTCYRCHYVEQEPEENFYFCEGCEEWVCEDCYVGDGYCDNCSYISCAECGGNIERGDQHECDNCHEDICSDCMVDEWCKECTESHIRSEVRSFTRRINQEELMSEFYGWLREKYTLYEIWSELNDDDGFIDDEFEFYYEATFVPENKDCPIGKIVWVMN